MKRSKPLKRKTPLRSGSAPSSSKGLTPRSKKMEATYRERRKLVAQMLDNSAGDNWCQVILLIQTVDPDHRCGLYVADVHEPDPRGRGGSITDTENALPICRPCHQWAHAHPTLADELGLLKGTRAQAPEETDHHEDR